MQEKSSQAITRRNFGIATSAAVAAAGIMSGHKASANEIKHETKPRKMLKTLKIGMVKSKGSMTDRFRIAKAAGFEGIELDAPNFDVDEVNAAREATGLIVDGSVCAGHWSVRHSSPDEEQRKQALSTLKRAIETTAAVDGHTVLLVVGHGKDGTEEEVWQRSVENIKQALPVCAEYGVSIAIENVWNQFLYEHGGPADQTADKFAKYVDEFDSPWVGMQFDIGNHWKYGQPGDWIRTLGRRIIKLDIKGFSRANDGFTRITEGDLPWADVRQALDDINFYGWVAAEVAGGDQQALTKVAKQIDSALNLS